MLGAQDDLDLGRIALRALVACVLTDLSLVALVALELRRGDEPLPAEVWWYALGHGLGAGVALAAAEAALRRWGTLAGLVAWTALCALAPLGATYVLYFAEAPGTVDATERLLGGIGAVRFASWLEHAAGAALAYGPLLIALRRGASRTVQAYAIGAGGVALAAVRSAWAGSGQPEISIASFAVLALGPSLLLPIGRGVGDALARCLLGRPRLGRPRPRGVQVGALAALVVGVTLLVHAAPVEPMTTLVLRLRAAWGDTSAMIALAARDFRSRGPDPVPMDLTWMVPWERSLPDGVESVVWYTRAAVAGDRSALAPLAVASTCRSTIEPPWPLLTGSGGVDERIDAAIAMCRAGAELERPAAVVALAILLEETRVRRDRLVPPVERDAAGPWLRAGAARGDTTAMALLVDFLARRGEEEDSTGEERRALDLERLEWLRRLVRLDPVERSSLEESFAPWGGPFARRLHGALVDRPELRRASDDALEDELAAQDPQREDGRVEAIVAAAFLPPERWCVGQDAASVAAVRALRGGDPLLARARVEEALAVDRLAAGPNALAALVVLARAEHLRGVVTATDLDVARAYAAIADRDRSDPRAWWAAAASSARCVARGDDPGDALATVAALDATWAGDVARARAVVDDARRAVGVPVDPGAPAAEAARAAARLELPSGERR